jgi:hypothetical protein
MRSDRDDADLSRSTRNKLLGSVAAVALVLSLAAVRQSTRKPAEPTPVEPVATKRTVFGEPNRVPKPVATHVTPEPPKAAAPPAQQESQEGTRARSSGTASPKIALRPIPTRQVLGGSLPEDLHAFLDRWRGTLVAGDANAQANLYAQRVERFLTKRNVTREQVRREKAQLIAQYPAFQRYNIDDVRVESMDSSRAVVSFRKDWDARGNGRFAGSERQRLTLIREGGLWKIVGEEETKVYWVRRS